MNKEDEKNHPRSSGGDEEYERKRKEIDQKVLDSEIYPGKTVRELEEESHSIVDLIYIEDFARGISTAYKDERCQNPGEFIQANPDGSEDLVFYDIDQGTTTVLKRLAAPGKGKRAYLLQDPRYLDYVKQLKDGK